MVAEFQIVSGVFKLSVYSLNFALNSIFILIYAQNWTFDTNSITMKKLFPVVLCMIFIANFTFAQWTIDPENPHLVSDGVCTQLKVDQVADGEGGTFVFWMDSRGGCNQGYDYDIYGQHYDADGIELWEGGGREIINYVSSVAAFSVQRSLSDGEMVIGMHTNLSAFNDSLRFQKLNDDGMTMWENDLLVAKSDGCEGTYILGIENFSFFRDDSGYVVLLTPTYCGGSDGNRITRFSSDGVLTGPMYGEPEGNQYYVGARGIDRTYDGTNDIYLFHTDGNGAGAHARCMRLNLAGDTVWAPFDVVANTNGLSYQFNALSDPEGIAICFVSNPGLNTGNDIFLRKVNGDGSWAWNGQTVTVCGAEGEQGDFSIVQDQDYYYISWGDGRPGINCGYAAVYAQKVDKATGQIQWIENGTEIFDHCSYAPSVETVIDENGKLLICNISTEAGFGLNVQMVNSDGSVNTDGSDYIGSTNYLPFYHDYEIMMSGENAIVAWSKTFSGGGADGIYLAGMGNAPVEINETVESCGSYEVNGTVYDQSGLYTIELTGDTILTLDLTVINLTAEILANGNVLTALNNEGTFSWINCATNSIVETNSDTFTPLETGEFALIVELKSCVDTSDCVLVTVDEINEISTDEIFSVFPNPFNQYFNITAMNGYNFQTDLVALEISDLTGRVIESRIWNGETHIDSSNLRSGVYMIKLKSGTQTFELLVTKQN